MSQLQCAGCGTVLAYPSGAPSVVCAICRTINQPMESGMQHFFSFVSDRSCPYSLSRLWPDFAVVRCGVCRTDLAYPTGSPAVVCGVCNTVLQTPTSVRRIRMPRFGLSTLEFCLLCRVADPRHNRHLPLRSYSRGTHFAQRF